MPYQQNNSISTVAVLHALPAIYIYIYMYIYLPVYRQDMYSHAVCPSEIIGYQQKQYYTPHQPQMTVFQLNTCSRLQQIIGIASNLGNYTQ